MNPVTIIFNPDNFDSVDPENDIKKYISVVKLLLICAKYVASYMKKGSHC